jgi:outer membrane protein OmpA-like peptidoglycan-associated protein/tetratricopeptide (TPR) repeat protein
MNRLIHIILYAIALLVSFHGNAQLIDTYCNEVESKKALKAFDAALHHLSFGRTEAAMEDLADAIKYEPEFTEAWVAMSEIHFYKYSEALDQKTKTNQYKLYIRCLQKVVETCPSYNKYMVQYELGKMFFNDDDYRQAITYLKEYVKHGDKKGDYYNDATNTLNYIEQYYNLISNPVLFEPKIVEGVSTLDDDYLPIISPDGSIAFYTQASFKREINSVYGEKFMEVFTFSSRIDSITDKEYFSRGVPMPAPFNTGKNQGAASITIDNSTMYLTICEFVSRTYDNCDIYYTSLTNNGWSELKNLGPNINGNDTWESQPSITADGKSLYFASIRPGNIGFGENNYTSDIYVSTKDENGDWSPAVNLGATINTTGNEKSPFMHSDSKTLYFSSDGHFGLGGYDIFFSKYRDNNWTQPRNIGYPINTKNNDIGFIVSTCGKKAYFSSNKLDGKGGWDVYTIDLYEEARPEKVIFVKGSLLDDNGDVLADAKLEVRNTRTEEVTEGIIDATTGDYAVAVTIEEEEKNDDYLMVVKKQGYSFTSHVINPEEERFEVPTTINFEVKPIQVGKSVKINDINFATASAELDSTSMIVLNHFIEFLHENPSVSFEIRGHTDNVGDDNSNMLLSEERAKSVYDYLINQGINTIRMRYKGYGETLPVAPNSMESGRAQNRRTEFYITGK